MRDEEDVHEEAHHEEAESAFEDRLATLEARTSALERIASYLNRQVLQVEARLGLMPDKEPEKAPE